MASLTNNSILKGLLLFVVLASCVVILYERGIVQTVPSPRRKWILPTSQIRDALPVENHQPSWFAPERVFEGDRTENSADGVEISSGEDKDEDNEKTTDYSQEEGTGEEIKDMHNKIDRESTPYASHDLEDADTDSDPNLLMQFDGTGALTNISKDKLNETHYFEVQCLETRRPVFRYGELTMVGYLDRKYERYAVIGVGAGSEVSKQTSKYVFPIPMTALLWRRLKSGTLVIVVDSFERWTQHPMFRHVFLSLCRNPSVTVLFLPPARQENVVMLSQVSRLFAGDLILAMHADLTRRGLDERLDIPHPGDIMVFTTDADFWVFVKNSLPLPQDKLIVATLLGRKFEYKGRSYRMYTMLQGVGMRVATWHELLTLLDHKLDNPKKADDIVTYLVSEFGDVANTSVHKGSNFGWFLDQELATILIEKWMEIKGNETVLVVGRPSQVAGRPRLSHMASHPISYYNISLSEADVFSAHMASGLLVYEDQYWHNIVQLLSAIFGPYSKEYQLCMTYHSHFQEIIDELYGTEKDS